MVEKTKLKYGMMIDKMINYWDVLSPLLIDVEEECRNCKLRVCARNCPCLPTSMKLEIFKKFH